MYSTRLLLALFAALAATAANAKHAGRKKTTEMSPTATPTNESALSTQMSNNMEPGYEHDFESSLRKPLAVYTLPLSARVTLTPLGMRRLDQVYNECSTSEEKANETVASEAVYKPLGYIKYSNEPEMVLKYFLVKATWLNAQAACAGDDAALYTFEHPVQLDSAMANFYPLLTPWVDVQKPGVAGGSMLCGFLHGPVSGKSSLRWDDCNAMHDFICQKSATTSTTPSPQYLRGNNKISPRTTYVTLLDILTAYNTGTSAIYNLVQPALNAALLTPFFSTAQKTEITTTNAQWNQLAFVLMPGVIQLIASNPVLSPAQMQQIKTAATDGLAIVNHMQSLFNLYSSQVPPIFTPLFPLQNGFGESVTFYTELLNIFSNTLVQPTVTTTQAQTMNAVIAQQQSLYNAALFPFSIFTGTTTTVAPTTTASSIQSLPNLITAFITRTSAIYNLVQPALNAVLLTPIFTPAQKTEITTIVAQWYQLDSVLMPGVIQLISTNPVLSPAQMQQIQNAASDGLANANHLQSFANMYVSQLPPIFTPLLPILNALGESVTFYTVLSNIFSNTLVQPTVTTAQALAMNAVIAQQQSLYNFALGPFSIFTGTTTTLAPTTTATTTVASTTTASPIPPLVQIFQSIATATEDLYIHLLPILNVPNPSAVTTSVAAQIRALFSDILNLISTEFPNVITMLSTNPTLTPVQVQELKFAIAQGILIFTDGKCLNSEIASYLSLSPVQMQAMLNKDNQGLAMLVGLLDAVNLSNNLPTISAAQLLQLQNLLGSYESAITATQNTFPTTTTSILL